MFSGIPSPQKGQPLKASWAKQMTDAVNSFAAAGFAGTLVRDGAGAFGNAPLPQNQRDRRGAAALDASCWKIKPITVTFEDEIGTENQETGETEFAAPRSVTYRSLDNRYYQAGEMPRYVFDSIQKIDFEQHPEYLEESGGTVALTSAYADDEIYRANFVNIDYYIQQGKGYIALVVPAVANYSEENGPDGTWEPMYPHIEAFDTFAHMVTRSRNARIVVKPLYRFDVSQSSDTYGRLLTDFRNMPQLQLIETEMDMI